MRVEYNTTILDIVYDESGQPFSIRYKSNPTKEGVVYYYVLNAQGDVVGLLNSSGELVVEYKYDPWGKLLETIIGVDETDSKYAAYNNMGLRNPLRYRGYIYDRDTGLYYLQSRYYDPAICRFINADEFASTDTKDLLGANMFAYCENNPVNNHDSSGDFCVVSAIIGGVINMGLAVAGAYMDSFISGEELNAKNTIIDAVVAFGTGFIQGGFVEGALSNAINLVNTGYAFISTARNGGTLEEAVIHAAITYAGGKAGDAIGNHFGTSRTDMSAREITKGMAQSEINALEDSGTMAAKSINNSKNNKRNSTKPQKTTTREVRIHALGAC